MTSHERNRRMGSVRWRPAALGFAVSLLAAEPAWAYLDPATGWMILQGFVASLAAAGVAIGTSWSRVKGWFSPRKKPDGEEGSERPAQEER